MDYQHKYPQAAKAALDDFYIDDGLTGEDTADDAIGLQRDMQSLFALGCFRLRKWRASDRTVEQSIEQDLRDQQPSCLISHSENLTKVLGLVWDTITDTFRPMIPSVCETGRLTKRKLLSDIAKLFDILGWCSPAIIIPKLLLQRLWAECTGWDETVPPAIGEVWERWSKEIGDIQKYSIQRSYFPKEAKIETLQLHGFSDASELHADVVSSKG